MTQRPTLTNAVNSVFDRYKPANDREAQAFSQLRDVYLRKGQYTFYSREQSVPVIKELEGQLTSAEGLKLAADSRRVLLDYIEARAGSPSKRIKNQMHVVHQLSEGKQRLEDVISGEYNGSNANVGVFYPDSIADRGNVIALNPESRRGSTNGGKIRNTLRRWGAAALAGSLAAGILSYVGIKETKN